MPRVLSRTKNRCTNVWGTLVCVGAGFRARAAAQDYSAWTHVRMTPRFNGSSDWEFFVLYWP